MHPLLPPLLLLPLQDLHHHDLGTLGGYSAKVNAVVEAASFAGGYASAGKSRTPAQHKHACLWLENLGPLDLGTLGGEESEASVTFGGWGRPDPGPGSRSGRNRSRYFDSGGKG